MVPKTKTRLQKKKKTAASKAVNLSSTLNSTELNTGEQGHPTLMSPITTETKKKTTKKATKNNTNDVYEKLESLAL